jgi:pimeloyl-ACP methyl ester carboxylesterase
MNKVRSRDGTPIVFDQAGRGPSLILVDGALCYRAAGPSGRLAPFLTRHFTVFTYDRRGRGESGDTAPYAIEREVEDIAALVQAAGGSAYVYGISSGAVLALEAANRVPGILKLVLYEAPFIVDDTHPPMPDAYLPELQALVTSNRPSDAVKFFLKWVGVPRFFVALMPLMSVWSKLKAIAHTLVYDITLVKDHQRGRPLPLDRWSRVTIPTLVADGGKSPTWMRNGMRALAGVLPNAKYQTVAGESHMLRAKAIAPILIEFFSKPGGQHVEDKTLDRTYS